MSWKDLGSKMERFRQQNQNFFKVTMKSLKRINLLAPLTEFFGATFGAAIFVWIGKQVIAGKFSFGVFAVFLGALLSTIRPFKRLSQVNSINQKALAGNQRIYEILNAPIIVKEKANPLILKDIKRGIVFENVSFGYDNNLVLKDISFKANKGEIIGIVGPSGAGKSTLMDLILRFYDPQEGRILIDDIDIRDYSINSLRQNIGIVTQETILFNDSIRANIAYGRKDATEQEIIKAAKEACAHDFITKLPSGYDTFVGDRGTKLSGGERQRIAIARAILKNAPILILDEATSQLDAEAELIVQEAINNLVKGRTVFIIAHRLSSLRNVSKIIVLIDGKIVEIGTHQELINNQFGIYRRLYETQILDFS